MAKYKQHMSRHLASAKEWLTKAEQSFAKESDLRGELDLFLARAELEQAKKASRTHRLVSKYTAFLEQGLAVTIALAIFTFGFGASYLLDSRSASVALPVIFSQSQNASASLSFSTSKNSYLEPSRKEIFLGANDLSKKSGVKMVSLEVDMASADFSLNNSSQNSNSGSIPKSDDLSGSAAKVSESSKASAEPFEKQNSASNPEPELKQDTKVSAQSTKVSKVSSVSNEEIKKLIETAGKSLRSHEL